MKKFLKFCLFFSVVCVMLLIGEYKYHFLDTFLLGEMSEEQIQEYVEELRKGMLNGEKLIVLEYIGADEEVEKFVVDAIQMAYEIDKKDTSSDFDYMRYKHAFTNMSMTGYGRRYKIEYKMQYLESKEETDLVDQEIRKIFKSLHIEKMNDYQKIKAIHDYIIGHASYDLSTKRNSAYAALMEKSSACQGYAELTYKMMTEAGIPCRIIAGKADGTPHAWNIVKLENKWYNIDCTWDDPVGLFGKSSMRYEYFLKSDAEFKDHVRDDEYKTEKFRSEHVMAMKSYRINKK